MDEELLQFGLSGTLTGDLLDETTSFFSRLPIPEFGEDGFSHFAEGHAIDENDAVHKRIQILQSVLSALNMPTLGTLAIEMFQELVDDACIDLAFELHRAGKRGGMSELNAVTAPASLRNTLSTSATVPFPTSINRGRKGDGVDIYGNAVSKHGETFACMQCGRQIGGSRFAHHLDRCMGRSTRVRATNGGNPYAFSSFNISSGLESNGRASATTASAPPAAATGWIDESMDEDSSGTQGGRSSSAGATESEEDNGGEEDSAESTDSDDNVEWTGRPTKKVKKEAAPSKTQHQTKKKRSRRG